MSDVERSAIEPHDALSAAEFHERLIADGSGWRPAKRVGVWPEADEEISYSDDQEDETVESEGGYVCIWHGTSVIRHFKESE